MVKDYRERQDVSDLEVEALRKLIANLDKDPSAHVIQGVTDLLNRVDAESYSGRIDRLEQDIQRMKQLWEIQPKLPTRHR